MMNEFGEGAKPLGFAITTQRGVELSANKSHMMNEFGEGAI
jgi:hypothetical protein